MAVDPAWLEAAGVKRSELFTDDPTNKNIRFHDLRSTGLTWLALRGDDTLKIQHRAGHRTFAMTQVYIRTAENLRAGGEAIGVPFPELPDCLLGEAAARSADDKRQFESSETTQVLETIVEAPGIEPGSARRPVNLRSRA